MAAAADVSGNIQMIPQDSSTLDEPVSVTIKRDARAVMEKFLHVLIPRRNRLLLKDCEFLLCSCCLAPPIASKHGLLSKTSMEQSVAFGNLTLPGDLWGPLVLTVTLAM
jgi:hypothetical protein